MQRRLAAADDDLVVEVEVLDQRLVVGDVDGSPSSSWPLPPDSLVLNIDAYLLRFFQLVMSGYLSAIHGGTYQPIMPSLPVRPASWTVLLSVDVLLDQVVVAPVLDDRVDGAVGHALPADLLLDAPGRSRCSRACSLATWPITWALAT